MSETGLIFTPQRYPDTRQPNLKGDPGSRLFFFLRQAPKPNVLMFAGSSNLDIRIRPVPRPEGFRYIELGPRYFVPPSAVGPLLANSLIRMRALGAPKVSPAFALASLVRARGMGAIVVATSTPPDPPVPPAPPPTTPAATLSGGPRTIRSVRRRNVRHR